MLCGEGMVPSAKIVAVVLSITLADMNKLIDRNIPVFVLASATNRPWTFSAMTTPAFLFVATRAADAAAEALFDALLQHYRGHPSLRLWCLEDGAPFGAVNPSVPTHASAGPPGDGRVSFKSSVFCVDDCLGLPLVCLLTEREGFVDCFAVMKRLFFIVMFLLHQIGSRNDRLRLSRIRGPTPLQKKANRK